jgi:PTS system mannose-specific IIC component
LDYLVLGLVAGLAAVERRGFLQAMLSRPIALAPMAGLVLGDLHAGLMLAPPLELLWLGSVTLGAAVPAQESLGTVSITGAAVLAGRSLGTGVTPAICVLALVIAAPMALIGRRVDWLGEWTNEQLAKRAAERIEGRNASGAVQLNLWGLVLPFAIGVALAPIGAGIGALAIPAILQHQSSLPWLHTHPAALEHALSAAWLGFTLFSCGAGARALRSKRAQTLFVGALVAGVILFSLRGLRP